MFMLEQVVPWGRSFDEYRRMFALTDEELRLTILGCGDGPASFNAEATRRGSVVVSCDLGATPSPFVAAVTDECASHGLAASIERVPYQFQRGGNEMMRIRRIGAGR